MKKVIVAIITVLAFSHGAKADPTAIPIGDHIMLSLLSHVTAVEEDTLDGKLKSAFLDGIVQFGHYKGDYIFAIDAGAVNSVNPDSSGKIEGTVGIHAHAISALVQNLNINPTLANTLELLELNPRWSYDADVNKGVFSIAFGARIPF